jgi:hypothetical protein
MPKNKPKKRGRPAYLIKRKRWKVLTVETLAEAIRHYAGNMSMIAESFRICRQTVWLYIKEHPELEPVLKEAREVMVDECESGFRNAVKREEGWAVSLGLQTIGKHRGWQKGMLIGGGQDAQGQFTPVQITLPDNGRDPPDPQQLTMERLEAITEGEENGQASTDHGIDGPEGSEAL